MKKYLGIIVLMLFTLAGLAQDGQLRGFVYNQDDGTGITSATIFIKSAQKGAYSDENGFYSMPGLSVGTYLVSISSFGFDTLTDTITLTSETILNKNYFLSPTTNKIEVIQISASKQHKTKHVEISHQQIKRKDIIRIPSVGGDPDLVQYLTVLPGVVFSGDQGGQLYIRGGSPVMNRILLDGLTVYNPFHSIGLFSVFDSDILKTVDVYSAGFSAEYGGRISAIVDVTTRDGNKTGFSAKFNTSPFNTKILLEGPTKKYQAGKGSSSYLISYKNSYLDQTAPIFYDYVNNGELPYSFSDLYGKWSTTSSNGSSFSAFGFNFKDNVDFKNTTNYAWESSGLGAKFLLIPGGSKTIVDGTINYSDYFIQQIENDSKPRRSGINGYNVALNFTNYLKGSNEVKYGIEMNAFLTDFEIYNALNRKISQKQNTTEVSGYINYKKIFSKKLILVTGFRLQQYASLQETSPEPRIQLKYNINDDIRFKASAGLYSQNLMSAVSDRDVVNLFYGFLSGPDNLPKTFDGKAVTSKLQKARHIVAGFEFDPISKLEINVEGYAKQFTQVTNVNRDKIFDNNSQNSERPDYLKQDFIIERGLAYGYDITAKYESGRVYLWLVYSYNNVSRYDGVRTYQPHFDRRHNINFVGTYDFGNDKEWNFSTRWNFGSGFPFTLTQGFYELVDFGNGATTDYLSDNGELGILYANLNTGRLPYYHRLDASLKRSFDIKKKKVIETDKKKEKFNKLEITLSITNVYNRANIFYFNRVEYTRVNQLPILPAISLSYQF